MTLRITSAGNDLAEFISRNRELLANTLGHPWSRNDKSIWTMDLSTAQMTAIEEVVEKSTELAVQLRAMPGLPENAAITVWIVVTSTNEFIGLALSEELILKASHSRLGLVFSIYNHQS